MALDLTGKYSYPPPNEAWLAQCTEEVIAPELPIIDSHHHLWEEPGKVYLGDDFARDLSSGHNVVATVFVQAHYGYRAAPPEHLQSVGETEKIEAIRRTLAKRHPHHGVCHGIVGFADLAKPAVLEETLQAHLVASPLHFRGIRHSVARDSLFPEGIVLRPAPVGLLEDPRFRRSIRTLGAYGLSFDAMLYHRQIDSLAALAKVSDGTQIILDHVGCPLGVGPYRNCTRQTFDEWRKAMARLSRCSNVVVKFGGFGMIIMGTAYHLDPLPPSSATLAGAWRPFFEVCVEAFGVDRIMFESNFPVDKAMYSYVSVWNAFKRLAANASAAETAALFSGTAARVYRLTGKEPATLPP